MFVEIFNRYGVRGCESEHHICEDRNNANESVYNADNLYIMNNYNINNTVCIFGTLLSHRPIKFALSCL